MRTQKTTSRKPPILHVSCHHTAFLSFYFPLFFQWDCQAYGFPTETQQLQGMSITERLCDHAYAFSAQKSTLHLVHISSTSWPGWLYILLRKMTFFIKPHLTLFPSHLVPLISLQLLDKHLLRTGIIQKENICTSRPEIGPFSEYFSSMKWRKKAYNYTYCLELLQKYSLVD